VRFYQLRAIELLWLCDLEGAVTLTRRALALIPIPVQADPAGGQAEYDWEGSGEAGMCAAETVLLLAVLVAEAPPELRDDEV